VIGLCFLSELPFWLFGEYYTVHVQGLSPTAVIIVAEICAVVGEAILITILSKRTLPLWLIWMTSFLMNTASFLVGAVTGGIW
jgi:hypothetical protein